MTAVPPPPPGYAPVGVGSADPAAYWPAPPEQPTQFGSAYAGWWRRASSFLIDVLVMFIPALILSIVVDSTLAPGSDGALQGWVNFFLWVLVTGVYFVPLNGLGRGQTLGNLATGLAVRTAESGQMIGLRPSIVRWGTRTLLYLLALVPGVINDLWPIWDDGHQSLADKAAHTVMIRVR